MIWRKSTDTDKDALLRISQEPMAGKVRLIWGLSELRAPTHCNDFRTYTIETEGHITGCALSWNWPTASRYLSGLRFAPEMTGRPTPTFWKRAFTTMLEGVDLAWTSVGEDNQRAKRMLTSGVKWLPNYTPQQKITTWFIPLSANQRQAKPNATLDQELGIEPADWRHVAIASGSGSAYRLGRMLHMLRQPGVAAPHSRIRIGYLQPSNYQSITEMRQIIRNAYGYDGLVVILPEASELAYRWSEAAPKMTWRWHSTLYSVSWDTELAQSPTPEWKGIWL